ncbi:MAG: hypothetical protein V3573_01610 [Desulfovibrionaceae bacterium]
MIDRKALQQALRQRLGTELPEQATLHINEALQMAGLLEAQGFEFRLLDARPKSPDCNLWRAVFAKEDRLFQQEDPDAALAVCQAALAALS